MVIAIIMAVVIIAVSIANIVRNICYTVQIMMVNVYGYRIYLRLIVSVLVGDTVGYWRFL